jgi:hypothetical protein
MLCQALLDEAATVVVKRVTPVDVEAMTKVWSRAFKGARPADLQAAFDAWWDGLGPDARVDTLPAPGKIQVHLTALILRRSSRSEPGRVFTPPRPEFIAAHREVREAVRAGGPMAGLMAEVLRGLPEPLPESARRTCPRCDGSGWVDTAASIASLTDPSMRRAEIEVYPCPECRPAQFHEFLGGGSNDA